MRAGDVLDTLDRVALFRAQAADSHRRVEDIGGDLDSAISLLDLGQSRRALKAAHALEAAGKSCGTSLLIVCHQLLAAAMLGRSLEGVARGHGIDEFLPLRSSAHTETFVVFPCFS